MEEKFTNQKICIGDDFPVGKFHLHSTYRTVINFVNDQNRVGYITTNTELLAANALYVPGINLNTMDSLTVSDPIIQIGNLNADRSKMNIYESGLSFENVDFTQFEKDLVDLPVRFADLFPEKCLCFLIVPGRENFFTSSFDLHFMENAKRSADIISAGEIERGVKMIRGTGYGLTPSGDDFIAGLLLGIQANATRFRSDFSDLQTRIYKIAAGENLVTNSFLRNACNGKYFSPLKKILILLSDGNYSQVGIALKSLLSIGSTSGADLLTGYMFSIKHKTGI